MNEIERIRQNYCPACHVNYGEKCSDGEFGPEIDDVHESRRKRARRTGMDRAELDPDHLRRLHDAEAERRRAARAAGEMARRTVLTELPRRAYRGGGTGGKAGYPWDEWLDGAVWELGPADYPNATLGGFRSHALRVARERGLVFASRLTPDGALLIQARPRGPGTSTSRRPGARS